MHFTRIINHAMPSPVYGYLDDGMEAQDVDMIQLIIRAYRVTGIANKHARFAFNSI